MKLKAANEIGIATQHIKLPSSTKQEQLVDEIKQLNNNKSWLFINRNKLHRLFIVCCTKPCYVIHLKAQFESKTITKILTMFWGDGLSVIRIKFLL